MKNVLESETFWQVLVRVGHFRLGLLQHFSRIDRAVLKYGMLIVSLSPEE